LVGEGACSQKKSICGNAYIAASAIGATLGVNGDNLDIASWI
jgi:hypothetical protein